MKRTTQHMDTQSQPTERRRPGLAVKTGIKAGPIEIRELVIRAPVEP